MSQGHGDDRVRPDQLAAYADGELSLEARARIEAWLAEHPDAAAEVEALRSMARLWSASAPAEPSEADWARVLAGIEAGRRSARTKRRDRRRLPWGLAALTTAAAAIILAAVLSRPTRVVPPPDSEPVPVAEADDLAILDDDLDDPWFPVVVEPAPLALLGPDEAVVEQVKSEQPGAEPFFSRDASAPPMIILMPRDEEP